MIKSRLKKLKKLKFLTFLDEILYLELRFNLNCFFIVQY